MKHAVRHFLWMRKLSHFNIVRSWYVPRHCVYHYTYLKKILYFINLYFIAVFTFKMSFSTTRKYVLSSISPSASFWFVYKRLSRWDDRVEALSGAASCIIFILGSQWGPRLARVMREARSGRAPWWEKHVFVIISWTPFHLLVPQICH